MSFAQEKKQANNPDRVCVSESVIRRCAVDAAKVDHLENLLDQLKKLRSEYYRQQGQMHELDAQIEILDVKSEAYRQENAYLKLVVEEQKKKLSSRVGWYVYFLGGLVVAYATSVVFLWIT